MEIPAAQELVSYIEQIRAEAERLVEFVQTTSQSTSDDAVDELVDGRPQWREGNGISWVVLRDPEGNEFCVGSDPEPR